MLQQAVSLINPAKAFLTTAQRSLLKDIGLMILRLWFGGVMLLAHGWGKLAAFSELSTKFPDPLGVGSTLSLTLAVGAEVFAALAIVVGLATRLNAIPLIITMLVAGLIVHANDPFQSKELALTYLAGYIVILLAGPGRFSLDALLAKKVGLETKD